MNSRFDKVIDRRNTFCTQWDYTEDRFNAKGILPFSISDMDFHVPDEVSTALENHMKHGIFGYSRWNHEAFKGAVAHWYQSRFQTVVKQDWVLYSPTVTFSIAAWINILSEPEDMVVTQAPMYDSFYKVIAHNDRQIVTNALTQGNQIDFNDLEEKLRHPRAKILLLCNPHNPTGRAWTLNELRQIVGLCKRYDVFILADEIHMDLTLSQAVHHPIVQVATDYLDKVILMTSGTKTFNYPTFNFSYQVVPDPVLRDQFTQILKAKFGLSSPNVFGMIATIASYQHCSYWVDELKAYVLGNFTLVEQFIKAELPALQFAIPDATYLAWIDVSGLHKSDAEIQQALVHQAGVGIMPGSTYGADHFLRMNVGCPRSKVLEGLERLRAGIRALD